MTGGHPVGSGHGSAPVSPQARVPRPFRLLIYLAGGAAVVLVAKGSPLGVFLAYLLASIVLSAATVDYGGIATRVARFVGAVAGGFLALLIILSLARILEANGPLVNVLGAVVLPFGVLAAYFIGGLALLYVAVRVVRAAWRHGGD